MNPELESLKKYPVWSVVNSVRDALSEQQRAVLSSPTGSGKSTVLPLALLNEAWLQNRKIIMLEPRRMLWRRSWRAILAVNLAVRSVTGCASIRSVLNLPV